MLFSSTGDRKGRHTDTRPAGGVAVSLVPAARWQHSDEGGHRHVNQVSHLAGKRTGCRERSHVHCDGEWGATRDDVDSKLNVNFFAFTLSPIWLVIKHFKWSCIKLTHLDINHFNIYIISMYYLGQFNFSKYVYGPTYVRCTYFMCLK